MGFIWGQVEPEVLRPNLWSQVGFELPAVTGVDGIHGGCDLLFERYEMVPDVVRYPFGSRFHKLFGSACYSCTFPFFIGGTPVTLALFRGGCVGCGGLPLPQAPEVLCKDGLLNGPAVLIWFVDVGWIV